MSPHFELLTDAGASSGRETLARLEQIHHVFQDAIGSRPLPLPVRVFLFASERDFRLFRPSASTTGFFQSGAERDYIAMVSSGPESFRVVYHEYVHLVLNHSGAMLPRWLEEGIAEFYSTLQTRGQRVLVGSVIPSHVRRLGAGGWLDAATLSGIRKDSPYYNERERSGVYYAQCWALAHMLNMAPAWRPFLPRYGELLEQGTPAALAFDQAFSKSLEEALAELRGYMRQNRFGVAEVFTAPSATQALESHALDDDAAEIAQAELLLQMGRVKQAESKLRRLEQRCADLPEVQTALGLFALSRKLHDEAKAHLRRAIDLGATQALPYFEYAALLRDTGAPKEEFRRWLAQAAGRNPKLAEAQFLLGLTAQQDNRHRDAIGPLEEAVKILPRQSYFWHALAVSYHHLGDSDRARRAARKAADTATTQQELEMAQGALRLVVSQAAPVAGVKPGVTIPESWKPREGDHRVEGTLEQIDCFGPSARFQIRVNGAPVRLWVEKPGEVLLKSASSITFDFGCGPQRPRRVVVEFERKPGAAQQSEGVITAIEFQ